MVTSYTGYILLVQSVYASCQGDGDRCKVAPSHDNASESFSMVQQFATRLIERGRRSEMEAQQAAFSEDGYQRVAELEDDAAMESYIRQIIDSMGMTITSEAALKGFVPWYSGTKAAQTLKQMRAELTSKAWVVEKELPKVTRSSWAKLPSHPPPEKELLYRWGKSGNPDERWSVHSSLTDSAGIVPPQNMSNWKEKWLDYPAFCLLASKDTPAFSTFRQTYVERGYAGVDGSSYDVDSVNVVVSALRRDYQLVGPKILALLRVLKPIDEVGKPNTFDVPGYDGLQLSGLTMRYVKYAADMLQVFGPVVFPRFRTGNEVLPASLLEQERPETGPNIVEIGVGFGGQCAVLMRLFDVMTYTLVDLPEVLLMAERFLREVGVPMEKVRFVSATPEGGLANLHFPLEQADLVISTFAYTEVKLVNRNAYFDRVVKHARHGFIADNSGWTGGTVGKEKNEGAFGAFSRGALPVQLLMAGKSPEQLLVLREDTLLLEDPNAALVIFGAEYPYIRNKSLRESDTKQNYPIQKYTQCEWEQHGIRMLLCGASNPRAPPMRTHGLE